MMTSNVKLLSTNKVDKIKKTNISNELLSTLIKLTSNRDIHSYEEWVSILESEFNVIVPLNQLVDFFSLEREIEDRILIYQNYLNYG